MDKTRLQLLLILTLTIQTTSLQAKKHVNSNTSDPNQITTLIRACDHSIKKGQYENIEDFANTLLRIGITNKNDSLCFLGNYFLGTLEFHNQKFYSALKLYHKALFYINPEIGFIWTYNIYNNLSSLYYYLEHYKSGLKYITIAINSLDHMEVSDSIRIESLFALKIKKADIQVKLNMLNDAAELLKYQDIVYPKIANIDSRLFYCKLNFDYFINPKINLPERALVFALNHERMALTDINSIYFKFRMNNSKVMLAEVYLKLKEFKKVGDQISSFYSETSTHTFIDTVNYNYYTAKLHFEKENYVLAIASFKKLLHNVSKEDNSFYRTEAATYLKSSYENLKLFDSAYKYFQLEVKLLQEKENKDSMNSHRIAIEIATLLNENKNINALNEQLNKEKIYLLSGSISLFAIFGILILIFRVNQKKKRLMDKHNLNNDKDIKIYNLKYSYKIRLISEEINKIRKDLEQIEANANFTRNELQTIKTTLKNTDETNKTIPLQENTDVPNSELLKKIYNIKILKDEDWQEFRKLFIEIYPSTYYLLQSNFGKTITEGEMRLLMLMKLNYNYKTISSCLGVSKETTRVAIYRIRKKLNIRNIEDLTNMLS